MKKRIFPGLLCLGFVAAGAHPAAFAGEGKQPLKVTVETGTSKDGPTVKLAIVNESDTYQIFQSISCSWQDFWKADDRNTIVRGQEECGKNALYTIILAPHEKHAEASSLLVFRGKPGKRTIRFGYFRRPSDFTSAELKQIYHSPERLTYFSRTTVASRFKPGKEIFWSAPVTIDVTRQAILH